MGTINELFDCVYIINLDYRTDRLKSITDQFKKIDLIYKRFSAVKGNNGKNGCRLSHLAVLQDAKLHGFNRILICEDDLVLRRKFVDDIQKIVELSNGCDLLFFHHYQPSDVSSDELVIKHRAPWCTHLYGVFNINNVLNTIVNGNTDDREIDNIYVNSNLDTRMTSEEYAFQIPHMSDVSGTFEHRFKMLALIDDLLINVKKHEFCNVYKQYHDCKNPIFRLQDMHDGMGDTIMFLSKIIEVSNYYGNHKIKLSTKNKKIELMKEIIPMIDDNEFELVNDDGTIYHGWLDYCSILHYFKYKEKFKWKPNKSNCISYQLNGSSHRSNLKNCKDEDIFYFNIKMNKYALIDINKIRDFNSKVLFLSNSEKYFGIDSGNLHLAKSLMVPTTAIRNSFYAPELNTIKKHNIINNVYEIKNGD
jgi:hypothetical protein